MKQTFSLMILNVCCSPTQKIQPKGKGSWWTAILSVTIGTYGSSASILSDPGVKVPSSGSKSCLGQPTENVHGLGDRWPRRMTSYFLRYNPDLIPQGISQSPLSKVIRKTVQHLETASSLSFKQLRKIAASVLSRETGERLVIREEPISSQTQTTGSCILQEAYLERA